MCLSIYRYEMYNISNQPYTIVTQHISQGDHVNVYLQLYASYCHVNMLLPCRHSFPKCCSCMIPMQFLTKLKLCRDHTSYFSRPHIHTVYSLLLLSYRLYNYFWTLYLYIISIHIIYGNLILENEPFLFQLSNHQALYLYLQWIFNVLCTHSGLVHLQVYNTYTWNGSETLQSSCCRTVCGWLIAW